MPYGSITAQFQFHKGTIKPARCGSDGTRLYHFNSIKVRLNQAEGVDGKGVNIHFNSIKVRLNPLEHPTSSLQPCQISIP